GFNIYLSRMKLFITPLLVFLFFAACENQNKDSYRERRFYDSLMVEGIQNKIDSIKRNKSFSKKNIEKAKTAYDDIYFGMSMDDYYQKKGFNHKEYISGKAFSTTAYFENDSLYEFDLKSRPY